MNISHCWRRFMRRRPTMTSTTPSQALKFELWLQHLRPPIICTTNWPRLKRNLGFSGKIDFWSIRRRPTPTSTTPAQALGVESPTTTL